MNSDTSTETSSETELSKKKHEQAEEKTRKEAEQKAERAPYNMPIWNRLLNLVFGIAFIGLAFYALDNEETSIETALLVLGVILLLSGISRFIDAFYDKNIGGTKRLFRFIVSVTILALALIVIAFPDIGDDLLYSLLALGLILQGLGRTLTAVMHGAYPFWVKFVKIALGVSSLGLGSGAMIQIFTTIDYGVSLLLLIVIGFFISGLSRVVSALIGLGEDKKESK